MVSAVSGNALLTLFGGQSSPSTTQTVGLDSDLLLNYLQAKDGVPLTQSGSTPTTGDAASSAPAAPWSQPQSVRAATLVQKAIAGTPFIDVGASTLSAPAGASAQDYQKLFALYQGLNTLNAIALTAAQRDSSGNLVSTPSQLAQLQTAFASGLAQVNGFLSTRQFSEFNVVAGAVNTVASSSIGIPNGGNFAYHTGIVAAGAEENPAAAFQGAVQFNVHVVNTDAASVIDVPIDLSGMGATTRSVDNVASYINQQLSTAGVSTNITVANLGAVAPTVNGIPTANSGASQWGFVVNGNSFEQVSFSAPTSTPALYVGESVGGNPVFSSKGAQASSPVSEQLVKLQIGGPQNPNADGTNPNLPTGGVFALTLPPGVTGVRASAAGADGSVYMVADVSGSVSGAPVPGSQGSALLKYDSTGKLLFTKVLAVAPNATGLSVAVNSNGVVAVAGSIDKAAGSSTPGAAGASAFVQEFDATGAPTWRQTISAGGGDASASGVAFGGDGSVYLTGTTTGSINGQLQNGAADNFIQGFDASGNALFNTQYGASGDNQAGGIAYDANSNSIFAAGAENGHAVVRNYALNGAAPPTLMATRDLGSLISGSVAGVAVLGGTVIVGGTTGAALPNAGASQQAFAGQSAGFVATLSTALTPAVGDNVSYAGIASATQTVTGFSVAGGQAFLTGAVSGDPNSLSASGANEGFVAGFDVSTGAVTYAKTFTGAGGQAAPATIAAVSSGASVLDQLGLPSGQINSPGSQLVTANTAVQAGDRFYLRTSPTGAQTTITIEANDTLTTLAAKLNAALVGKGTATVTSLGATSQLTITPFNTAAYIELDRQAATTADAARVAPDLSQDVLSALGLAAGIVRTVKTVNNGLIDPSQMRDYGLKLSSNLNLGDLASSVSASTAIQGAIYTVQTAYGDLVNPPTLLSQALAKAKSGAVPQYLTAELANYRAGLARLQAG